MPNGTILIVDDDSSWRALMRLVLRKAGWDVVEAANGEEGIKAAREFHPDVVLCDLLMPAGNGFHVCRCLRADPNTRSIKIVITSGRSYLSDRLHALECGANEYLVKPVQMEDLHRLLRRLMQSEKNADPGPEVAPTGVSKQTMLRFWGVRGSIPSPGPATVHYGGNTSCVEFRGDGEIIILDSGSGIRPLGRALQQEFKGHPLNMTLLLSHTHWDHIQGFPFFQPAYNPDNRMRILGYEGTSHGLAGVLSGQMESPYFPIGLEDVPGNLSIEELKGQSFTVGNVRVKSWFVNHPGICVGYRLDSSTGSVVYIPDVEPFRRLRDQPNSTVAVSMASMEYARHEDHRLLEFMHGADVLIMDSQYDEQEYATHVGWGHACVDDVVSMAILARVKRYFLFHHDPSHDDETVSRLVAHARQQALAQGSELIVEAAREGLEIHWDDKGQMTVEEPE